MTWGVWAPAAVSARLLLGRGGDRLFLLWTGEGFPGSLLTELGRIHAKPP